MARRTPLYDIDPERGDHYTRLRETSIELVQFEFEVFASIAWAFEKWMTGKPGDPIPTLDHLPADVSPREIKMMNGYLLKLIEHQKVNVRGFIEKGNKNRAAANIRWGKRDANALPDNANVSQNDANAPDRDIVEAQAQSLRASTQEKKLGGMGGCLSPSGVANVAPPEGGTFARVVVDGNGTTYSEEKLRANPVEYIYKFAIHCEKRATGLEPSENDCGVFKGTLKKRAKELGRFPGLFSKTCFDIVAEYCDPSHYEDDEKGTYTSNIRRTIQGRLKGVAIGLGLADS